MPKPRRLLDQTAELTTTPPAELPVDHAVARITAAAGKNLYTVELPSAKTLLVELTPQFRNTFWLRKGGFVVVDTSALAERENKLGGEIVNVVRDEKRWRKMSWWPQEFPKPDLLDDGDSDDDGEEESRVGKLPPSDSEED